MIKIVITDPHTLNAEVLMHTARYLTALANNPSIDLETPRKTDVSPQPAPAEPRMDTGVPLPEFNPFAPPIPPVVVPPPAAVIPELPEQAPPIPGVVLDADGLPWDVRIHSKNKTKTLDGRWKLKREVSPDLVAKVVSELQQTMAAPRINAPHIPTAPLPPTVEPIEQGDKFQQYMSIVMKALASKKWTHEQNMELLKDFGISSPALVSTRPDLIPSIIAKLNSILS